MKLPPMLSVKLWNNWTVGPCLYSIPKQWLLIPYEMPGLRVVAQLLQLHRGHGTPLFKDVCGDVKNVSHGALLSTNRLRLSKIGAHDTSNDTVHAQLGT